MEIQAYNQTECPEKISTQIVRLLKTEWPEAFTENELEWPSEPEDWNPVSIVLLEHCIVLSHAAEYIDRENADFSIFTCDPSLVHFYESAGWELSPNSPLIGGTEENHFRSNTLGKCTLVRLISEHAKRNRGIILSRPVFIELGEDNLW